MLLINIIVYSFPGSVRGESSFSLTSRTLSSIVPPRLKRRRLLRLCARFVGDDDSGAAPGELADTPLVGEPYDSDLANILLGVPEEG